MLVGHHLCAPGPAARPPGITRWSDFRSDVPLMLYNVTSVPWPEAGRGRILLSPPAKHEMASGGRTTMDSEPLGIHPHLGHLGIRGGAVRNMILAVLTGR